MRRIERQQWQLSSVFFEIRSSVAASLARMPRVQSAPPLATRRRKKRLSYRVRPMSWKVAALSRAQFFLSPGNLSAEKQKGGDPRTFRTFRYPDTRKFVE
jgi:hypothetical protein